ncbi:hypothetical protein GCM10010174_88860 [Kutzneria viridogrisea]|uniref:Excreted virulence factor EspC (Type VII ESX diderm) n=1 Tax=Kutzneria viridogrisea TaxID=47990 RepID=A0ABR6BIT4_9PSEU|nr:hypothetical protein [Kutzneria viridogrisea]
MAEGYQVVPQALRNAQRSFEDANDRFAGLTLNEMPTWHLGDGDLGLLGRNAGVVVDYNQALETVREKSRSAAQNFSAVSDALNTAAKVYEAQDEEYYKQFGWLAQSLDGPYQPSK